MLRVYNEINGAGMAPLTYVPVKELKNASAFAEASRSRLYQAIDRAEEDFASGRVREARQVGADLRSRYGL